MNEHRWFSVLVLLLFFIFPSTVIAAPVPGFPSDPERIEAAAQAVVKLTVYDDHGDKIGTGSGFAAGEPAVLVTACHVVVNMEYMVAERDDGTTFRVDHLIDADEDKDIAIAELPEDAGIPALAFAAKEPARGEKVLVIGSQFGLTNLVTDGIVCGRWDSGEVDWVLFTAPVSGGNSGGPVFDDDGTVIGVVMGTYEKAQNLNLATPADDVIAIMDGLFR